MEKREGTEKWVLKLLGDLGPLSIAGLSIHTGCSQGSMNALVSRLVQEGEVRVFYKGIVEFVERRTLERTEASQ